MSNVINRCGIPSRSFSKYFAILTLPTIITDVAGYLAVAGSVMGAVSQSAVLNEEV
jgi:hypothetical protein